jgi:hypothetical protein
MRRLPLESGIAGVAILTDSFGLFETDEENEAVLHEAARILSLTGRLLLKVVNGAPILESFRATDRERRDGTIVAISRTLAHEPPQMTERMTKARRASRPARRTSMGSRLSGAPDGQAQFGKDRGRCSETSRDVPVEGGRGSGAAASSTKSVS